ncbi:hypothetical protein C7451_101177 [Blastomonas natatoria]|uniref:Lipoprotein n=1 Tax=Blastomonas natatoria TaxID=34015 RepID=A0A2V3VGF3_9SPHN|nr:hypothetical protein [Blastomonas natatoria]PXW79115.1 hypothetical protein C7451_101177 [Blastomonas natatoria]
MRRALLACLLLAGCSVSQAGGDEDAVTPLDAAAINAGVIADPHALDLAGSFSDPGAAGNDAFCARGNREKGYKVGVLVTFGASSQCEGTGIAQLAGEAAELSLSRNGEGDAIADCRFSAQFDGNALVLPGSVPAACEALCSSRASLAGASFALVEPGNAAAGGATGRSVKRLCAG